MGRKPFEGATDVNEIHNPKLSGLSRTLRKRMTPEEKHLWYDFLKDLSVPVHRQKVIGDYIVDFCIADPPLVIEVDGAQHGETRQLAADTERDHFLQALGYKVLRYSNWRINKEFRDVCTDIYLHVFPEEG